MPIPRRLTAWHAAALYLMATVAWTWPLATTLSTRIAWDLGDPMLQAWIMGWVNDSAIALFRGDIARFNALWDPPIFYPEPLTLAFSEHNIPQALFVLPLHAITGNVVLGYNVALLATFVLSGAGMFLLARELTGSPIAALLAGAIFAFTPYRVDQLSHLHILSSQWMPLSLYGLRRYFTGRSRRPLVWAVLALVMLNLSTGYYLFFFAPFVVAYVLTEMSGRRLLRDLRTWIDVAGAGAATAALTIPFLIPYLAARLGTVGERSVTEVREFSADVYGYATASDQVAVWGGLLRAMRRAPENALFPGSVAAVFGLIAVTMLATLAWRRWRASPERDGRRGPLVLLLMLGAAASLLIGAWILLTGGRIIEPFGYEVRLRNFSRFTIYGALALGAAIALSSRLRAAFHGRPGSLWAAAIVAAAAAFMLSLGPRMETLDEAIGEGPYALLFEFIPGFDGLRVPSRYAMIVVFALALAAAYAAAAIAAARRWGAAAIVLCAIVAAVESRPSRFKIAAPFDEADYAPLAMSHRLKMSEPLYDALGRMPRGVLLELPWGSTGWDLQYMHAQRRHQWPLVNGFSGFAPQTYWRNSSIKLVFDSPDRAWWGLERSGASHVIVHQWAFRSLDRGKYVAEWLRKGGAVEVASTAEDVLFRLPGGIRYR